MGNRVSITSAVLAMLLLLRFEPLAAADSLDYRPITSAAPMPLPAVGPTSREEMQAFIDGFMAAKIKAGPVAGAAVAVVKDGALFFSKGYGFEDVERRIPVDPAMTLFRAGSVSKLFTGTAVMQLVERGKVDLDTDVNRYLKDMQIPATFPEPITLRNILTHTAGFEDGMLGYFLARSAQEFLPQREWLIRHMPRRVRPPVRDFSHGFTASYSNYATTLAGHIVENVSGVPFDEYIEQNILQPLGMTRSTFREPLPATLAPRMSAGYVSEDGTLARRPFELAHAVGPAASLSTTVIDMTRFMLAHLQGGALDESHRILKPETAALMQARAMSRDPALNGMALSFMEQYINGRRTIGHSGDTVYFHSVLSLLPEASLGLFVSVNTSGRGGHTALDLERAFYQHYFPAELPRLTARPDARERNEQFAGTYRTIRRSHTAWEKILAIGAEDHVVAEPNGALVSTVSGVPARWIEVGDGVFRAENDDLFIAFKTDSAGRSYLVDYFPALSTIRLRWREHVVLQATAGAFSLVLLISMIVSAIRQRRVDTSGPANLSRARRSLALVGVFMCAFVGLFGSALTVGIEQLLTHVPMGVYLALAMPLIALPFMLVALYFIASLWRHSAGSFRTRVYFSITALGALTLYSILRYWNLLGYRFN